MSYVIKLASRQLFGKPRSRKSQATDLSEAIADAKKRYRESGRAWASVEIVGMCVFLISDCGEITRSPEE